MSKTVDELAKTFRAGLFAHLGANPYATVHEGDRAGIAAVVRALRDAIVEDGNCKYCVATTAMYNQILGDAGEKVADTVAQAVEPLEVREVTGASPVRTATDPAPAVCEWWVERDPDGNGHYETKCGNDWLMCASEPPSRDGYNYCPSCGKPILFAEAK